MVEQSGKMLLTDIAKSAGVAPATLRAYLSRARDARKAGTSRLWHMPEPDGQYDRRTPWWYVETVNRWMTARAERARGGSEA